MASPTQAAHARIAGDGPITTGGEVFPDGTLLELVRDSANPSEMSLLRWKRGRSFIAREMPVGPRRYVPLEAEARLVRRLPSTAVSYASTDELFGNVQDFITKFSGLSQGEVILRDK